jgi:hypothetical protein
VEGIIVVHTHKIPEKYPVLITGPNTILMLSQNITSVSTLDEITGDHQGEGG